MKRVQFLTQNTVTTMWWGEVSDDLTEADIDRAIDDVDNVELGFESDIVHETGRELVPASFREFGDGPDFTAASFDALVAGFPGRRDVPLDPAPMLRVLSDIAWQFGAAFSLTVGRVPTRLELFDNDETLRGELAYSDVGVMQVDSLRAYYNRGAEV